MTELDVGGPATGRRPVVARSLWTIVGQVLSSSSNFILSLLVLTTATPAEFATFSVGLTSYLLVTQLSRSVLSLPILLLYADQVPGMPPTRARAAPAVAACVLSGAAGAAGLAVASQWFDTGRAQLLVLAAFLPALQYQDAMRHVAIAAGRPELAARSDGAWVAAQVSLSGIALAAGWDSATSLLAIWAAAGACSGFLYGLRLRVSACFGAIRAFLVEERRLLRRLAVEFVMSSGSFYGLSYGLAVVAGTGELGRVRAAQSLIGPVSVLLLSGSAIGVPESVRARSDPRRGRRLAIVLSAGFATAALLGGAVVYAVLPTVGPEVFPETWVAARPLLPMLTLFAAAVGASTGAVASLRTKGDTGWIVRGRAASGAVSLVVGLPLSATMGAPGALIGLACSEILFAVAAWARLCVAPGDAGEHAGAIDPVTGAALG